ncbi:MAG: hypothetical protein ABIF40_00955 [archaeon]
MELKNILKKENLVYVIGTLAVVGTMSWWLTHSPHFKPQEIVEAVDQPYTTEEKIEKAQEQGLIPIVQKELVIPTYTKEEKYFYEYLSNSKYFVPNNLSEVFAEILILYNDSEWVCQDQETNKEIFTTDEEIVYINNEPYTDWYNFQLEEKREYLPCQPNPSLGFFDSEEAQDFMEIYVEYSMFQQDLQIQKKKYPNFPKDWDYETWLTKRYLPNITYYLENWEKVVETKEEKIQIANLLETIDAYESGHFSLLIN